MGIDPANKVNQEALENVIKYSNSDLSAALSSGKGLQNAIDNYTYNERLYFQMMLASRLKLYNDYVSPIKGVLVNKATKLGGVLHIGIRFPTAFPYDKPDDITDWSITGGHPIAMYRYMGDVETIWGPGTYWNTPANWAYLVSISLRHLVYVNQHCTHIRVGVQATWNHPSTVWNVSIGQRDSTTMDVVAGTFKTFTFNDINYVQLIPGESVYSDWLEYEVDVSPSCYFISMYCEGSYSILTYGDWSGMWYIPGDVSKVENWDDFYGYYYVAVLPHCLRVIQGRDMNLYPGWDSDQSIEKWILNYNNLVPMIWSKPYGTKEMVRIMNRALPSVTSKANLVQGRNSALGDYVNFKY